jgi:hypothetical protein
MELEAVPVLAVAMVALVQRSGANGCQGVVAFEYWKSSAVSRKLHVRRS